MTATFSKMPKAATRGRVVSPVEYLALGVLADYADTKGWCHPSHRLIGLHLDMSKRSVIRVIAALEEKGLIEVERGKPTGCRDEGRHRYRILFNPLPAREYVTQESPTSKENVTPVSPTSPELVPKNGIVGDTRTHKNGSTPIYELDLELDSHGEGDDLGQAVRLWNDLASKLQLPICKKVTPSRRSKLRARLRESNGLTGWRLALAEVDASPFLKGETGGAWRPDIDFMLSASKFTKLLEGGYRPRANGAGGNGGQIPIPARNGPNPHGLREVSVQDRHDLIAEENNRREAAGLPRLRGDTETARVLVDAGIWPYDEKPRYRSLTSYL